MIVRVSAIPKVLQLHFLSCFKNLQCITCTSTVPYTLLSATFIGIEVLSVVFFYSVPHILFPSPRGSKRDNLAKVLPHFLAFKALLCLQGDPLSLHIFTGLLPSLYPAQKHIDREKSPDHLALSSATQQLTLCPVHCVCSSWNVSLCMSICLKSLCTSQFACLTHLQHLLAPLVCRR